MLFGCQPPPGGGSGNANGNSNSGNNTNFTGSIDVNLGAVSQFELDGFSHSEQRISVSLTAQLGINQLSGLGFALADDEVSVEPGAPADSGSNGLTTLDLLIAPVGTADACTSGIAVGRFNITFDTTTIKSITPAQVEADADALATAGDGAFELCLRADSGTAQTLIVNRLRVLYNATTPALTCAEILALDEVQAAVAALQGHDLGFSLQEGNSPPDIEGTYAVTETISFDPDDTDTNTTRERVDVLGNQTDGHITRATGEASLQQSLSGNEDGVNLCVLARSNNPDCDQTIARLESYTISNNGTILDGRFLAVVVERHTSGVSTCGQAGDFIHGTIHLTRQSTTFQVARLGKVPLPENFKPELLVLPDDGSPGTVTDRNSDTALRFPQDGTYLTTELHVPDGLDADGYNGIALAPGNSHVALLSDNPNALLIFDNLTSELTFEADAGGAELGRDVFDFSTNGEFVYVVSPDPGDADNVSVFHTYTTVSDPLAAQYRTPNAETPELSRLNPTGDQLAVLLDGEADDGTSQWVLFYDLKTGFFAAPVDLHEATGGYVKDRFLIYSRDGSRVFMAGDSGVVAVETTEPFTVANVDVSGGNADEAIAIDISHDSEVLVVVVKQIDGDNNFAIVDTETLTVLNRQFLEGIYDRVAIDIAHFETGRACLVINERARVVAVQTVAPFAVSEPLSAADDDLLTILGRVAVGGSVIAVANTSEPAIYLFQLAP